MEQLCLDDAGSTELNELASRCEEVYGPARDIEWAIADGKLYLLQCRAVTRAGGLMAGAPVDALRRVPLFADLERRRGARRSRSCSRSVTSPPARRS